MIVPTLLFLAAYVGVPGLWYFRRRLLKAFALLAYALIGVFTLWYLNQGSLSPLLGPYLAFVLSRVIMLSPSPIGTAAAFLASLLVLVVMRVCPSIVHQ